jgi:putative transposase
MDNEHNLRLKSGDAIRIDGRAFVAGTITDGGRMFMEKATGTELLLSNSVQIRMAREGRISTETMYKALTVGVQQALATDWDAMLPSERETAQFRYKFVQKVQALPRRKRNTTTEIRTAIDEVYAEIQSGEAKPSPRSVRHWNKTYVAAGKDIRALSSLAFRRGRGPQLLPWIREEINRAIDEIYATQPPGNLAETRRRAIDRIRIRAEREGRSFPSLGNGQRDLIGINAVARVLKDRDQYEILVAREGKAEADRVMEAVREGPQGSYPLESVEIDHTLLDIVVIDDQRKIIFGRPWLTALLDRYSRCVIGFCISFSPPSWATVMEALRHAVSDKKVFLSDLGGITNAWPCRGVPDELICDNGRDFHSTSMQETEAALNMRILYLPRKKGWLKGKVERWFRTLEEQVFHLIPGTTLSNVVERKDYDSEEHAVMSLKQVHWIVTKWICDIYHLTEHSRTGQTPLDRWNAGISACGEKLPPPPGLLVPLTGMVVPGTLNREGVRFQGLCWNGNAFSALRNRLGTNPNVLIRIDPLDLQHAYALDPEKRCWVRGDLVTSGVEDGLTLHQYQVLRRRAREIKEAGEDQMAALSRARSELFDFIQGIVKENKKSKAGKRFARFYADGRKPAEHMAKTVFDPQKSAAPLGSHPIAKPPVVTSPAPFVEQEDPADIEPLPVRRHRV